MFFIANYGTMPSPLGYPRYFKKRAHLAMNRILIKTYGDWSNPDHFAYDHSQMVVDSLPQIILNTSSELNHLLTTTGVEVEIADCRMHQVREDHPDLSILFIFQDLHFSLREQQVFTLELTLQASSALRERLGQREPGNEPFPTIHFQMCSSELIGTALGHDAQESADA